VLPCANHIIFKNDQNLIFYIRTNSQEKFIGFAYAEPILFKFGKLKAAAFRIVVEPLKKSKYIKFHFIIWITKTKFVYSIDLHTILTL